MIGAVVFAIAGVGFAIVRSRSELHPPYAQRDAAAAARRDPDTRKALAGTGWDSARVIPLDRTHWRVTFLAGPREVLDVAVNPRGHVDAAEPHAEGAHALGAATLWSRPVLLLFTALFVVAVVVKPLRSLRNLDAVVIGAGFTLSALLIDDRLVAANVYIGAAVLLYVASRCAAIAFSPDAAPRQSPPLGRLVPIVTAAVAAAAVLLVVTSTGVTDVAFAGELGVGMDDVQVVHGDTYPLLTYVLYMPVSAIAPVRDSFDSLDGALWLNAAALLIAAAFTRRWGTRTVLAWLAFPPVLLAASSGGNDVLAGAFVVAALALAADDRASAGLFTLAGWVKIAPAAALIPLLARLRGARLAECIGVVIALVAAGLFAMLAIGGTDAIEQATRALRFQFERGSWFSVWRQLGLPAVQVALQAATIAFAVVTAVAVRRRRETTLRQLAGFAGALIALIQLSANYWTYTYLAWLLPFILVALFPPGLRRSPPPEQPAP